MKQEDILIWLEELATDVKNIHKHKEMDGLVAYVDITNFSINPDLDKCTIFLERATFEKVINILDLSIYMVECEINFYLYFEIYDVLFYTMYKKGEDHGNY